MNCASTQTAQLCLFQTIWSAVTLGFSPGKFCVGDVSCFRAASVSWVRFEWTHCEVWEEWSSVHVIWRLHWNHQKQLHRHFAHFIFYSTRATLNFSCWKINVWWRCSEVIATTGKKASITGKWCRNDQMHFTTNLLVRMESTVLSSLNLLSLLWGSLLQILVHRWQFLPLLKRILHRIPFQLHVLPYWFNLSG